MESVVTHLEGSFGVTEKIKGAMYKVCREYLYIGFLLNEVKEYEYYREKDYDSVYSYALQELNFKKSTVTNFIAVFNTFALENYGQKTMFLQDEYENFKYSQLCEMLSLSAKQRAEITPNTTVREIRQMKKSDQTSGQNVVSLFAEFDMTVSLPLALADKVNAFAASSGVNLNAIVINALEAYLNAISSNIQKMG